MINQSLLKPKTIFRPSRDERVGLFLLTFVLLIMTSHIHANDPFDCFTAAYREHGGSKYMINEEIVQSTHVLQAAYLAKLCGAPEDVIIGLLFHDIGQVIDPANVGNTALLHAVHDEKGAQWLADNGFPANVIDWVRFHTLAKVVLCMEDPDYYTHLSEASKESYQIQRSKYLNEEGQTSLHYFNQHQCRADFLRQRKCDDMAKITDFETTDSLEDYREMTFRVIAGDGASAARDDWRENIDSLHSLMCQNRSAFEEAIRQGGFFK